MTFDLNSITIDTILPIIQEIADKYLTRENSQNITVKGDSNFVTEVDTNIEKAMKERLLTLYPDTQFMGEEGDNRNVDFTTPVWILDPVDGTSNLIHDFQNSSMSLALAVEKQVVFGVIYHYSTKEYFYAKKAGGFSVYCIAHDYPIGNKVEPYAILLGTLHVAAEGDEYFQYAQKGLDVFGTGESTPVTPSLSTPEATPETTPESTQEDTSHVRPPVTPKPEPGATPETTLDDTPEATP